MKKIYSLIFIIFLCGFAQAQQNTFEKVIDTLGCREASCVQQTFDGGYIICGVSSLNNNDGAIVKLDSLGDIEWVKLYGGSGMDGLQRIEQLPDSGYVASGSWNAGPNERQWLLRLSANGDTLWTRLFKAGTYQPEPVSMASGLNNLYPLTGYFLVQPNNNDVYLMVADTIGGISFFKAYSDSLSNSNSGDVAKTYDNGYAITGTIGISPGHAGVLLIRTDSLGDTLWSKTFLHSQASSGLSLRQTNDSGFIIAAVNYDTTIVTWNIYLIRTNSSGDTLWTKVLFYPNGNTVKSIDTVFTEGFILVGRIVDTLPLLLGKMLLVRVNNLGDTLWSRHYPQIGEAYGNYVTPTTDHGFIATGTTVLAFYIVKTDSLGNVNSGVGLNEINYPQFDFNVYPNPGSGIFRIDFNREVSLTKVKVLNNLGDIVINKTIESCSNYCLINLSGKSDGMYYIILENGKNLKAKKISLIR